MWVMLGSRSEEPGVTLGFLDKDEESFTSELRSTSACPAVRGSREARNGPLESRCINLVKVLGEVHLALTDRAATRVPVEWHPAVAGDKFPALRSALYHLDTQARTGTVGTKDEAEGEEADKADETEQSEEAEEAKR